MSAILQELLGNAAEGGATFDILQPDSFFIPFGEYPHKAGLQLFDEKAAQAIAANHNGLLSKISRWASGASYPVYIGHPDLPGSKDADKRAYGWIENMTVEAGGLRLGVKWSDEGRDLVSNAYFKFYSPLWWTTKAKGGIRPTALKSMGLTNDPNIPVPALANEADPTDPTDPTNLQTETTDEMKPELLAALGLDPAATHEDAMAAIAQLTQAAAPTAEEAPAAEATETPAVEAAEPAAEEEIPAGEADPEKQVADDCAAAKVKSAANDAATAAVASGRILFAEHAATVESLLAANDFGSALADLRAAAPKVKTVSATGPLGAAKVQLVIAANDEVAGRRAERAVAVANELQAITNPLMPDGERRRVAWQRAQAKNPSLFGKAES